MAVTDEQTASFLGLAPNEWMSLLGGTLGGVSMQPWGPRGNKLHPFLPLYGLSGIMEQRKQKDLLSQLGTSLSGGEGNPYGDQIQKLIQGGQVGPAMTLFTQGIREREQGAQRAAAPAALGALDDVQEPQIMAFDQMPTRPAADDEGADTGMMGDGSGALLTKPPPVSSFTTEPRAPTVSKITERVRAMPQGIRERASEILLPEMIKRRGQEAVAEEEKRDFRQGVKQIGGASALKTANPETLEALAAQYPGKLGTMLSGIARARRDGDARTEALIWRKTDAEERRALEERLRGQSDETRRYTADQSAQARRDMMEMNEQYRRDQLGQQKQLHGETEAGKAARHADRLAQRQAALGPKTTTTKEDRVTPERPIVNLEEIARLQKGVQPVVDELAGRPDLPGFRTKGTSSVTLPDGKVTTKEEMIARAMQRKYGAKVTVRWDEARGQFLLMKAWEPTKREPISRKRTTTVGPAAAEEDDK